MALLTVIAMTDIALTRPDLKPWMRVLDVGFGLALATVLMWFTVVMRRAFRDQTGYLELRDDAIVLYDSALFDGPWELPMAALRGVCIDARPARIPSLRDMGRFPISNDAEVGRGRLSRWLFSMRGGSPLPMLGGKQVPNVVLLFRDPMRVNSLRRRGGLSALFAYNGPVGADRPLPAREYRGVLLAIDDPESVRRFFADGSLLLHSIPAEQAQSLGATLEREWGRRYAVYFFVGLMVFLLFVRCQLLVRSGT